MKEDLPPDPAVDRLHRDACEGCAESRLLMSRRAMLGVSAGLFSWAFMLRPMTVPSSTLSAANSVVVPLRL